MKIMIRGLRGKANLANFALLYEGTESDGFGYVVEYINVFEYFDADPFHQWEIKASTERICNRGGKRKLRKQARLDRMERLGLYKKPDPWADLDLPF